MLLLDAVTNTRTVIRETIPLTFYIPVLVSILTAAAAAYATIRNTKVTTQTQREMANLADRTARDFKEKDYKNDFYKKIIDKRLAAWEHAERFVELIGVSRNETNTNQMFYIYFMNREEFSKVQHAIFSLNTRAFWMNTSYRSALIAFNTRLGEVASECSNSDEDEVDGVIFSRLDNNLLIRAGIKYHSEFRILLKAIMDSQSIMLRTLYDIENFLAENG